MKTKYSFLLLTLFTFFAKAEQLDVENVDERGKPIRGIILERDQVSQDLLDELELTAPDEAEHYKYFTEEYLPRGPVHNAYKYRINDDYTTTEDAGSSWTYDFRDGGGLKTTHMTRTIHHPRRVFSNSFEKLRSITLDKVRSSRFAMALSAAFFGIWGEVSTQLKYRKDQKYGRVTDPDLRYVFAASFGTMLASVLYLYHEKVSAYKAAEEDEYIRRRSVTDAQQYFECDELEREFGNPITWSKVILATAASIAAGVGAYNISK